jgi:UDP-N-acetylglucosamine 2-epimerase (non-hydrolysing)
MRLCTILGTRPEIVKMSPVIRYCREKRIDNYVIHTGQHYSYEMDGIFFNELELPAPEFNLKVGSGSHGEQTGKMLAAIEALLKREGADMVYVQGDTNTVLAGALAAVKLNMPVGHIEAGLRSLDRTMPEEINRVAADHISTLFFAPTERSAENLRREGITEGVHVTGNTVVDAVRQNLGIARRKADPLARMGKKKGKYILCTLHRAENVDDGERLRRILAGVDETSERLGLDVILPMHPRTRKNVESFGISISGRIEVVEPVGFLDFLRLEAEAALAMTDSGGVQEESCILGVPCVTLRENTERPETVECGANVVVGNDPARIASEAVRMAASARNWTCPLGDGRTGETIVSITEDWVQRRPSR